MAEQTYVPKSQPNWPKPHISSREEYERLHAESISNPTEFWGKLAKENLDWFKEPTTVKSGTLEDGGALLPLEWPKLIQRYCVVCRWLVECLLSMR
jgi:hypothetical protein